MKFNSENNFKTLIKLIQKSISKSQSINLENHFKDTKLI